MRIDDLKRSIDSIAPGDKLKAKILALPERPSRPRLENPLMHVAAIGAACLICVGIVTGVMLFKNGGNPGSNVLNPAASSNTSLAAGPGTETATPAETQATPSPVIDPTPSEAASLEPTSPKLSPGQDIGVDMAFLDYASDDIVIFHGYFGLFVYDLKSQKIIRSLDLKPIGCEATQGDHSGSVSVSADGNTVQLHRISSKNMFVYTVSDNTLRETANEKMKNRFTGFVDCETDINYVKLTSRVGLCSYRAVRFDSGEYGYLRATSDWTVGALTYVRGDTVYEMFTASNDPQPSPNPAPGYDGAPLLDEPPQDVLSIGVTPTVFGIRRRYYVPDDEARCDIVNLMEHVSPEKTVKMEAASPTGVCVSYHGYELEIAADGSVYYGFRSPGGKIGPFNRIKGFQKLRDYVLNLIREKCGITQIEPTDIKDIVRAEMAFSYRAKPDADLEVVRQVVLEPEKLKLLEGRLSNASAMQEGSACPFGFAILELERKDGKIIQITIASDSCQVYAYNGVFFDYDPERGVTTDSHKWTNSDVLALFDKIPWMGKANK